MAAATAFSAIGETALVLAEGTSAVFLAGTTLAEGLAGVFFATAALPEAADTGLSLAAGADLTAVEAFGGVVFFEVVTSCLLAVSKGQVPDRLQQSKHPKPVHVLFKPLL
ncbi:hypothetical protein [Limnohabitans sp. 2KL-1]|uniref:hypothetical protein n=1 Tax=Limnohabitans sp. 2KL-1 TaxID=1100699 RepID=UPI0011B236B5|nr:hypothetical protein [Limnohabitans sp. 2KL-1]